MLNALFSKAASAMSNQSFNAQKEHWNNEIESVKFQGHIIDLAYALNGEDEPVVLD